MKARTLEMQTLVQIANGCCANGTGSLRSVAASRGVTQGRPRSVANLTLYNALSDALAIAEEAQLSMMVEMGHEVLPDNLSVSDPHLQDNCNDLKQ